MLPVWAILTIVGVVFAVLAVAPCVLSSQISQEEERRERGQQ